MGTHSNWKKNLRAAIGVVAAIVFATTAAAQAAKPVVETDAFHHSLAASCGSFDALFEVDVSLRANIFSDNDGNETRYQAHFKTNGTVTNSVTGRSFQDNASFVETGDFASGEITSRGVFTNINVPGHGVVALAVGRFTTNADDEITFESGQGLRESFEQGLEFVCPGLASL